MATHEALVWADMTGTDGHRQTDVTSKGHVTPPHLAGRDEPSADYWALLGLGAGCSYFPQSTTPKAGGVNALSHKGIAER